MKKIYSWFFLTLCLYCGCKKQERDITSLEKIESIAVNPMNSLTVTLNDLYSDCAFIKLETVSESLLSGVNSLYVFNNRIYIYNNRNGGGIYCFDMQGKYLYKIANIGQGPGETTFMMDFCIDESNDRMWIADNYMKILKYDLNGHFIQEYKTDFAIHNIEYLPGSDDLLVIRFGYYEDKNYEVGVYSLASKQLLNHKDYASKFEQIVGGSHTMFPYRNNLVYAFGFTNTVFYIDAKGIHPQYALDFGKCKVPENLLKEMDNKNLVVELNKPSNNYAGLISRCIETDEYITFHYSFRNENRISVYSKQSGVEKSLEKVMIDNQAQPVSDFLLTHTDSCYYSVIYPHNLLQTTAGKAEIESAANYGVYKNLDALRSVLKEDDNPVIVCGKSNLQALFYSK
ncbi:MAG: 6-bladed beta-propeller [Tannerella sp.]|jgi:hypothetical protein|nr:6-bladed beta-propeller [Tannerella sp.]